MGGAVENAPTSLATEHVAGALVPQQPSVSVIVPTRNSGKFLERCLLSIKQQTYPHIELIVIDNHSKDATREIARRYTSKVYLWGPERSAQVNLGAELASGDYVYKVDSDFILEPQVVHQCIDEVRRGFDAVVVHNSPDASVSWIAKIRKFEVDMYKYDLSHSSARFVRKDVYRTLGGFNERITAGEDYDFQNRLNRCGYKTSFVRAEALHLGEPTSLWLHLKKYFRYGRDFVNYKIENPVESKRQLRFFRSVYLKNWQTLLLHPGLAASFLVYNLFKFAFGTAGFLYGWAGRRLGDATK